MRGRYASIGFEVEDEDAFRQLAARAAELGEERPVASGRAYHVWTACPDVELWAQSGDGELIGLNPHFRGPGLLPVALVGRLHVSGQTPLDATLHAWAAPETGDPASGLFPLVFDCPDHGLTECPPLPATGDLQLAVFARKLGWHEDEEAFARSQPAAARYAAESFIPTGLFGQEPEASALVHGRVVECGARSNAEGALDFWAARIATLGGEVAVVAPAELVDGDVPAGAIVAAEGWLTGCLTGLRTIARPAPAERRSRLRWPLARRGRIT